jgi:hypothetical protein
MGTGNKNGFDPLLLKEVKVEDLKEFVIGEAVPCRPHASVSVGVKGGADRMEAGERHWGVSGWILRVGG